MTQREVVTSFDGNGVIRTKAGRRFGCTYQITISQEIRRDRMNGTESVTEGQRIIEGAVMGVDCDELFHLEDEFLVLELEDGQFWECILKNTDGDLVNTGKGLYRKHSRSTLDEC